jgi:hypothetical protein
LPIPELKLRKELGGDETLVCSKGRHDVVVTPSYDRGGLIAAGSVLIGCLESPREARGVWLGRQGTNRVDRG